jgi:hypothetical protein
LLVQEQSWRAFALSNRVVSAMFMTLDCTTYMILVAVDFMKSSAAL